MTQEGQIKTQRGIVCLNGGSVFLELKYLQQSSLAGNAQFTITPSLKTQTARERPRASVNKMSLAYLTHIT